jgi:hypothetical protein
MTTAPEWWTLITDRLEYIASRLSAFFEWIFSYDATSYGSIIIGTLVSSFAGAYGAQWIVERRREKEEILREIRSCNAAITLSYSIASQSLGLKEQLVKPMKNDFDGAKAAYAAFEARRRQNQLEPGEIFELETDFKKLPILALSTEPLSNLLYERISLAGKPILALTTLLQSFNDLTAQTKQRNAIIDGFMARSPIPPQQLIPQYFGLKNSQGIIDQTFSDLIEAIAIQLNNCIFFSDLLCKELIQHRDQLQERYGRGAPKKISPSLESVDPALMPNPDDFKKWTSAFESPFRKLQRPGGSESPIR